MAPPPVRPPRRRRSRLLAAVALAGAALLLATPAARAEPEADNWAVIVSSSRYWLNYRHTANALGIYQAVRRCGGGPRAAATVPSRHLCYGPRSARERLPAVEHFAGSPPTYPFPGAPPPAHTGWASRTTASCSCWPTSTPARPATRTPAPCSWPPAGRRPLPAPAPAPAGQGGAGGWTPTCCLPMPMWTIGAGR